MSDFLKGEYEIKVKRSSAGLGLFAMQDIPKGQFIIEYFGRELTPGEEYKSKSKYLFEINSKKTIDGTIRANTARYINHSCRPNCEVEIKKGKVLILAKKISKQQKNLLMIMEKNIGKSISSHLGVSVRSVLLY